MGEEERELQEYKREIAELFESKSDLPIGNSKTEHAAALYELFFKKAKQEVVVFCKDGSSQVFDEQSVKRQMHEAATKNGIQIRVVVQDGNPQCKSLDEIKTFKNVAVKKAAPEDAAKGYNFCVVDGIAFRYERDREEHVAFARMNYPPDANKLLRGFDEIWARAI